METTKEQVQQRMRQWKLANQREIEELRRTTPDKKLAQLWTLMMITREMGWDEKLREEEKQVRALWIKLRKLHALKSQSGSK